VSDAFEGSEEDVADFFILLDPIQSDRTTTTIGRTGDPTRVTYVLDDNVEIVDGEIHFYQEDTFYYYRYKVADQTYPSEYTQGYMFDPGEELEVQIFSSDRIDSEDVSGLNLNIINETDMVVNIVYYTEDFENPRLVYTSQGAVEVH
jgi:type IV pilus assembly protein PilO